MSKNEKPPGDAPLPGEVKRAQPPIPVQSLTVQSGMSVDFPGKGGSGSVSWTHEEGRQGHQIHYLPGIRHHRVAFIRAPGSDGQQKVDVRMIHESWVSWVPREES